MDYNEAHSFLDAIEEMHIRLLDGSEMTKQAVSKLTEETQEKIADFRRTKCAYKLINVAGYVIYSLNNIKDPTERMDFSMVLMGTYANWILDYVKSN